MPQHVVCHAGVDSDPEGVVHDEVRTFQIAHNPVAAPGFPHLVEGGVFQEIAGKEVARLDLF